MGFLFPFVRHILSLTQFESQLIDFTFYGGYFIGSLILFYASKIIKVDILNYLGYKNSIAIGLVVSAGGALLMIPAVGSGSFAFILAAFFVVAIGFSLQQTAANPFVVALGSPVTGANRLNLAGGVNNLGGILGPIAVSIILFGTASSAAPKEVEIESINMLYYILAGLFLAVALYFWMAKLPKVTSDEKVEASGKTNLPLFRNFCCFLIDFGSKSNCSGNRCRHEYFCLSLTFYHGCYLLLALRSAGKDKTGWGAMGYPQLILGMIAIFTYVGVEVTIQSNMGALLELPNSGD
jgi:FHS family L-fucose permease-like MFS transporter